MARLMGVHFAWNKTWLKVRSTVFISNGRDMVRDSESWERYKWVIGDSLA